MPASSCNWRIPNTQKVFWWTASFLKLANLCFECEIFPSSSNSWVLALVWDCIFWRLLLHQVAGPTTHTGAVFSHLLCDTLYTNPITTYITSFFFLLSVTPPTQTDTHAHTCVHATSLPPPPSLKCKLHQGKTWVWHRHHYIPNAWNKS